MIVAIPIHCVFCNDALVSEFFGKNNEFLKKTCSSRPDHKIKVIASLKNLDVLDSYNISISMNPFIQVVWDFREEKCYVAQGDVVSMVKAKREPECIPWVEPDFEDPRKLAKRIKNLLVFL